MNTVDHVFSGISRVKARQLIQIQNFHIIVFRSNRLQVIIKFLNSAIVHICSEESRRPDNASLRVSSGQIVQNIPDRTISSLLIGTAGIAHLQRIPRLTAPIKVVGTALNKNQLRRAVDFKIIFIQLAVNVIDNANAGGRCNGTTRDRIPEQSEPCLIGNLTYHRSGKFLSHDAVANDPHRIVDLRDLRLPVLKLDLAEPDSGVCAIVRILFQ